jgi:hypothetical protein
VDTHKVNGMCAHALKNTWKLKDEVIQVTFEVRWKKTWKTNQKVRKNGQIVNKMPTLELKHDKIW